VIEMVAAEHQWHRAVSAGARDRVGDAPRVVGAFVQRQIARVLERDLAPDLPAALRGAVAHLGQQRRSDGGGASAGPRR
jgi:hypothetical protein